MRIPERGPWAKLWRLDPNTVYLNHGSFGACPRSVLDEQSRLRAELEDNPMQFFLVTARQQLLHVRERLAQMLRIDVQGLTLQLNSTAGVNTVLQNIDLSPGDELIVPDHAYQACRNAIDHCCRRTGAVLVTVPLPFPLRDPAEIIEAMLAAVTPRSRLALIDTVSSPTAIRMPFEALTTELQSRGVDVLLDASHSLGLIDLDLNATPAAYATGNAHKWLCTPKGSAFLYVRPDKREDFHPLAISHGYSAAVDEQARFEAEFEWIGTLDPTPWLCIPHALDMLGGLLDGGWPVLQKRNHELALYGRDVICDALGIEPPVPDSMLSAMATVELPAQDVARPTSGLSIDPLMQRLYDEYRIQTVVFYWPHHQRRYLRISAALYNERQDYDYLATALKRCLAI